MSKSRVFLTLGFTFWVYYAMAVIPLLVEQVSIVGGVWDWSPLTLLIPVQFLAYLWFWPMATFWVLFAAGLWVGYRFVTSSARSRIRRLGITAASAALASCFAVLMGLDETMRPSVVWSLGAIELIPARTIAASVIAWAFVELILTRRERRVPAESNSGRTAESSPN